MGEEALSCQVLTGYLLLNPAEEVPTVEAAQNAVIKLLTVEPGKEVTMQVKAGDKVIYSKYAGTNVELDGVEYIVVKQSDILAIVED